MPKADAEELYEPITSGDPAGSKQGGAGVCASIAALRQHAARVLPRSCPAMVVVLLVVIGVVSAAVGLRRHPRPHPPAARSSLPTHSSCDTLCPGCHSVQACHCPAKACWPGSDLHNTTDRTCSCFAQLSLCADGVKPVYTAGHECPSCWPADNHACDCFGSLGYCDPVTDGPPFGAAGTFDSLVLARFWSPPAARPDGSGPQTNLTLHGVWPQYDEYMCAYNVLGDSYVEKCREGAPASDRHGWPQYCGAERATNWSVLSCIDPTVRAKFAAQWRTYAPGYLDDGPNNFATHEWTKHGTCAARAPPGGKYTLADAVALQERYFQLQIDLMRTYPTPQLLRECAQTGVALNYSQIRDAFEGPETSVALQCKNVTDQPGVGRLTMVSMCFGDSWQSGLPARKQCSAETCLSSFYDNGCEYFDQILVDGVA